MDECSKFVPVYVNFISCSFEFRKINWYLNKCVWQIEKKSEYQFELLQIEIEKEYVYSDYHEFLSNRIHI